KKTSMAALLGLVAVSLGCPPAIPPDDPRTVRTDQLPKELPALLVYARKEWARALAADPMDRTAATNSLSALRKAQGLEAGNREVLLRGAEVARALGERSRSPGEQRKYATIGLEFTGPGRKRYGGEVAFHYFHAALLGLQVDAYRAAAFSIVPELRKAAERAVALDRTFDSAGPLRILGSFLVQVPSTAPFNGDIDRGTKLLQEAVKLAPSHPLNHYFLAEAYALDEEADLAAGHFGRLICAPRAWPWDRDMARRYEELARKALAKLKRSPPSKCQ
ncbi:MAG: hypothetical protein RBU30_16255, partial [Polyangia bacterium]|nr:hypothetical protein [Polyangia bacterium]